MQGAGLGSTLASTMYPSCRTDDAEAGCSEKASEVLNLGRYIPVGRFSSSLMQ